MEWPTDPHAWIALATLTALEIVLGIENVIGAGGVGSGSPPQPPVALRAPLPCPGGKDARLAR